MGKGLKAATDILSGRLKRRRITRFEFERLAALLSGGTDFSGFARIDLVIEAVFEDLELKRKVLAETEAATAAAAIFATNTSTIPIAEIAAGRAVPVGSSACTSSRRWTGCRCSRSFRPRRTSPETIVTAVHFGRKIGKTVIVVRDHPGFWVNRILTPYMNEAGYLFSEGVPMDVLDRVMTRFGFPVGPITLLDEVGLDVGAKAGKVMHAAFGDRLTPSDLVGKMLADQRLGRKNGKGFYLYHKDQKTGPDESVYDLLGLRPLKPASTELIEQRLVYAMLNEAAMAFGEGVVRSARDGDIGAIFGIGYPPFRGGPLRYLDDIGAGKAVQVLRSLEAKFGARFTPAETLVSMAANGGRFYPAS